MKRHRLDTLEVAAVFIAVAAFALFLAGFFVPPLGIIDGSVLKAGGEMLGFVAILFGWYAFKHGGTASVSHGNTSATIHGNKDECDGLQGDE